MFRIFADTLRLASRANGNWDAPRHWVDHDHRTRAEKERDAQEHRRWLRQTGIL